MRYVGIYWALFAPMMKRSIKRRFDSDLADQAIRRGKGEYRRLLSRADDLGPGNPMAMNAYFAYVITGSLATKLAIERNKVIAIKTAEK